jgi:hypothetical protein
MIIAAVLLAAAQQQPAWTVTPLAAPTVVGSAASWEESAQPGSAARLQWLEADPPRLMSASWSGTQWSPSLERARGEKLFINWADVPAAARDADGRTAFTWLPKTGGAPYDYHARFRFEDPQREVVVEGRLHDDAGAGEHGFVALAPLPGGGFFAAWLDGREHARTGQQLRGRAIRADGSLGLEILLDDRCCDCCPTTALALPDGRVLVAWRDRTADEIRDISFASGKPEDPGSWSAAATAGADGWLNPG